MHSLPAADPGRLGGLGAAVALAVALVAAGGSSAAAGHAAPGRRLAPVVSGHFLERRWVYISTNFQVDANVAKVKAILDRAASAGYNGALVADGKLGRLDDGSLLPRFYTNLRAVLDHTRALDIDMVPATAHFGYSAPLLWHNPDLAEGVPVRRAPFVVAGGRLVPDPTSAPPIVNGDFEDLPPSGDEFPGWGWQDEPGVATFVDRDVVHSGRASLRMEDLGRANPPHGNGRVFQRLAVTPFQNYHVAVWYKTQGFMGGDVRVLVLGGDPTRTLQWNPVPVEQTGDWRRFDVTFNSLDNDVVRFYLGVWGGGTGTIWWDDARLEPAGFVNMIRRPGAPVRLTSPDGVTVYEEGRDVAPVVDPRTGTVPYNGVYDLWHDEPVITVPPGSRLADGDRLLASYYHMATVYGFQVTASLTEPEALSLTADEIASVHREFSRRMPFLGWMFSHDEIRVHGWDEAPAIGAGTPGDDLAFNVRTLVDAARQVDGRGRVFVWSDMFDPYHNAAAGDSPYYLVNGSWAGSWEGLDPEVTILNWNHRADRRRKSAEFFAGRGHRQILAGYYDAPAGEFTDRDWLADLEGVDGIEGVMYTQWGSGYDNLEAWADHVWGDAEWVPVGQPPAGPRRLYLPRLANGQGAPAPLPDCGGVATFADGHSPSREIHVAPGGSDTAGDGKAGRPFATISRAAREASPGTAIRLHAGTYPGGDVADAGAAHHEAFRHLARHDIGSDGNQDCLKLSGLNDVTVLDSEFARGINMGGSTGAAFFRPPLDPVGTNAEARDVRVIANVISGSRAPFAFVGCVACLAANNTVVDPDRWLLRILQEITSGGGHVFEAARDGQLVNNLFYFQRRRIAADVNIGPGTAADTFRFDHNVWFAHDDPARSAPVLPVAETDAVVGLDPDFTSGVQIGTESPAFGAGRPLAAVAGDIEGRCYRQPPSIGAYEAP